MRVIPPAAKGGLLVAVLITGSAVKVVIKSDDEEKIRVIFFVGSEDLQVFDVCFFSFVCQIAILRPALYSVLGQV